MSVSRVVGVAISKVQNLNKIYTYFKLSAKSQYSYHNTYDPYDDHLAPYQCSYNLGQIQLTGAISPF